MKEYRAKLKRQIIWMIVGIIFDHCDLLRQRHAAGGG